MAMYDEAVNSANVSASWYGSGWEAVTGQDTSQYLGGTYHATSELGDYVDITFDGSGLGVYGTTNAEAGIVTGTCEGGAETVALQTSDSVYMNFELGCDNLVNGPHTFRLELVGAGTLNIDSFYLNSYEITSDALTMAAGLPTTTAPAVPLWTSTAESTTTTTTTPPPATTTTPPATTSAATSTSATLAPSSTTSATIVTSTTTWSTTTSIVSSSSITPPATSSADAAAVTPSPSPTSTSADASTLTSTSALATSSHTPTTTTQGSTQAEGITTTGSLGAESSTERSQSLPASTANPTAAAQASSSSASLASAEDSTTPTAISSSSSSTSTHFQTLYTQMTTSAANFTQAATAWSSSSSSLAATSAVAAVAGTSTIASGAATTALETTTVPGSSFSLEITSVSTQYTSLVTSKGIDGRTISFLTTVHTMLPETSSVIVFGSSSAIDAGGVGPAALPTGSSSGSLSIGTSNAINVGSDKTSAIVGSVIAGFAVLVAGAIGAWMLWRRRRGLDSVPASEDSFDGGGSEWRGTQASRTASYMREVNLPPISTTPLSMGAGAGDGGYYDQLEGGQLARTSSRGSNYGLSQGAPKTPTAGRYNFVPEVGEE